MIFLQFLHSRDLHRDNPCPTLMQFQQLAFLCVISRLATDYPVFCWCSGSSSVWSTRKYTSIGFCPDFSPPLFLKGSFSLSPFPWTVFKIFCPPFIFVFCQGISFYVRIFASFPRVLLAPIPPKCHPCLEVDDVGITLIHLRPIVITLLQYSTIQYSLFNEGDVITQWVI